MPTKQQTAAFVLTGLLAAVLAGCSTDEDAVVADASPPAPTTSQATAAPGPAVGPGDASPSPSPDLPASPSPSAAPSPSGPPAPPPSLSDADLARLGVNELGRVLVGEWHVIGDTDGEYRTSRATLRQQLTELYERGYRPVTQQEFLAGTFPIPAGTSPVLLTFDDSTRGQFALDGAGEPTADSAVGIIEAFAADRPDWRATAVFAFNFPEPFGDARFGDKLRWLVDNGYELSNHSVGHANLGELSSAELTENLAENLARLHDVVPDAPVPSLTLPLGIWPDDRAAALSGSADGTTYRHELVYLVGSDPTRSPHHVDFEPAAIQRVPAHAVVGTGPSWFGDWLDRLDDEGLRFVADGDPDVVTFPTDLADVADVDPAFTTRTYEAP